MSKSLQATRPRRAARRNDEPRSLALATSWPAPSGFIRFSYAYAVLYSQGGRNRVKAGRTRLHDGKLSTEAFECELGDDAYQAAVRQLQQQLLAQAAWLLRPFSWLPSLSLDGRSDEDRAGRRDASSSD